MRRITGVVGPERDRLVSAGASDPDDSRLRPAVEDGDVLGDRDAAGSVVECPEIQVGGAPVGIEQLLARECERSPELDQRQDPALACLQVRGRRLELGHAAQIGSRLLPAVRAREVDQLANGQCRHEPVTALLVEPAPGRVGDRGVRTKQVVHSDSPFRLPIPNETSAVAAPRSPYGEPASALGLDLGDRSRS